MSLVEVVFKCGLGSLLPSAVDCRTAPSATSTLPKYEVPGGRFCPSAISYESIRASYIMRQRRPWTYLDTKVKSMLNLKCFQIIFCGFTKEKT